IENELVDIGHRLGRLPAEHRQGNIAAGCMGGATAHQGSKSHCRKQKLSHLFFSPLRGSWINRHRTPRRSAKHRPAKEPSAAKFATTVPSSNLRAEHCTAYLLGQVKCILFVL